MLDLESYAVYVRDTDDCLVTMPTLRRAFDYVTGTLCHVGYRVEVVEGGRKIVFGEHRWRGVEAFSDKKLEGDAWNELMRLSLDGRLRGFAAMPVKDFYLKSKRPR
jgi:hypothetical protein